MSSLPFQYIENRCLTYVQDKYPNLEPTIAYLSTYNAIYSSTSIKPFTLYIGGTNFSTNNITTIHFGNFQNIPIVFFSSTSISFIIPLNAKPGDYMVTVVNSNSVGSLNSNSVIFTII